MTKTCSQCGAVLPSSARTCNFCESSFVADSSSFEQGSSPRAEQRVALDLPDERGSTERADNAAWRGELAQRLRAYNVRRRKVAPNNDQSQFSFEEPAAAEESTPSSVAIAEPQRNANDDFSFTIAIGRPSKKHVVEEAPLEIDVSEPVLAQGVGPRPAIASSTSARETLASVASLDDRRLAALIDAGCLLFAYGAFLTLFASLGGEFTLSKLTAAVYTTTFAIVYVQYFALFTIFGGTTPGMILRGLQVTSFTGESPTPRQMLLRSAGYLLSAGTFFLGFLWAMWDEDELTWHDRLSRTYLSNVETLAEFESSSAVHPH